MRCSARLRSLLSGLTLLSSCLVGASALGFTYVNTFDTDYAAFGGNDGWFYSYCGDTWTTALNGGVAPLTDDGCGTTDGCSNENNCGYNYYVGTNCSGSDPVDNHVQGGSILWKDYQLTARFRNEDNDTFGFVFRYRNNANFYLYTMSREYAPNPPCAQTYVGSRLYRISSGSPSLLGQSALTYEISKEHSVRITVNGSAVTVELDVNSDGQFSDGETAVSVTDGQPLPNGRVGFYAYDNGAAAGLPCQAGGCWFDDLQVDVWSLAEDKCQGISYEGACNGTTLSYCFNGELYTQPCTGGCCRWYDSPGYFSCGYGADCGQCVNECVQGTSGCSKEATHEWVCGNVDADPCTEKVLSACPSTGTCDPKTGKCLCVQQCAGKQCGDDGCGGLCGKCNEGWECKEGMCVETSCVPACEGAQCGPDGCSGSCGQCPAGEVCDAGKCVAEPCQPKCAGKQCGADGCGGSCGTCTPGFECNEMVGLCIDAGGCKPEAYRKCVGKDLYWFDSCDLQGPLSKACEVACVDNQCVEYVPKPDGGADVIHEDQAVESDVGEPDTGSAVHDDTGASGAAGDTLVTLGGKRSGGCSAGGRSAAPAAMVVLVVLLLAAGRFARRSGRIRAACHVHSTNHQSPVVIAADNLVSRRSWHGE